jgi:predicted transcriptional regulator
MPALLVMNIILVVFNMIPAFPMDGGRVFRALLSIPIGRLRATKVASIAGQVISVLFVFYGFYIGAYTLAIIGFYIFSMARAENNMVQLDSVLKRYTAADLLRTQFTRLSSNDWIQTPIELLRHGLERNFLVFDINDQLVGVLDEAALIDAMQKRDLSTEISRYMRPVQMVQTTESLQNIYQLLRTDQGILAVINNHELIGVVDQDGLRNFMRLEGK